MPFDADLAAIHNPSTGGVPSVAWGDAINANFAAIGAAWTSYTPTWTGTGSNPAIGNGTLAGAYLQLGKTLLVRIRMVAGSTTTYGTGTWAFALPAAAATTEQIIPVYATDSSATANYSAIGYVGSGASTVAFMNAGAGAVNNFGPTVPFTWAQTDRLLITGAIELG